MAIQTSPAVAPASGADGQDREAAEELDPRATSASSAPAATSATATATSGAATTTSTSASSIRARSPLATRRERAVSWLEEHALFVVAVSAVLVLTLAGIPSHLAQDGWLALVAGRVIAEHGIPHQDFLTVMAHGVRWTDQQWLAQLTMYELQRAGGFQLLCVVYVCLTTFAFGGAIAAARRLGAQARHIIWMLPFGTFFYLATAVSIRTQGFAYPLFVATLWLLAAEVRSPERTRRVWLVFPMLVVWANLHGSVTLGVGLAVLYGVCLLYAGLQGRGLRGLCDARGVAFVLGSPLTLLLTPYGTSVVHYYSVTLLNPEFGKLISEWAPATTIMLLAVPLLVLVVAIVWLLGRSGRRTPLFDHLALAVLALGAIFAVRNVTWFGLAMVILVPPTISRLRPVPPRRPRRRRLDLTLALGAVALSVLGILTTAARPASWFVSTYPTRSVAVVSRLLSEHPHADVFADVRFADWLVWENPALAGRIAYDTSFENLTTPQLQGLNELAEVPEPGHPNITAPFPMLMLYPTSGNRTVDRILLAAPGTHVVLHTKRVLVATRPVR